MLGHLVSNFDEVRHGGAQADAGKPWPREFLTLAVVSSCLGFWTLVLFIAASI
jgi:hypothetical protein